MIAPNAMKDLQVQTIKVSAVRIPVDIAILSARNVQKLLTLTAALVMRENSYIMQIVLTAALKDTTKMRT